MSDEYKLQTSLTPEQLAERIKAAFNRAKSVEGSTPDSIADAIVEEYKKIDPNIPQDNLDWIRETQLEKVEGAFANKKAAVAKALHETMVSAISDPNANKESIVNALTAKMFEIMPSLKTDEKRKKIMSEDFSKVADTLLAAKKEFGPEGAAKKLEESQGNLDKFSELLNKDKKTGTPYYSIGGATLGFVASEAMDVGNWTSFSGILKKIGMITAGLGIGLLASNEYGVRTQLVNMVSGDKNKDQAPKL